MKLKFDQFKNRMNEQEQSEYKKYLGFMHWLEHERGLGDWSEISDEVNKYAEHKLGQHDSTNKTCIHCKPDDMSRVSCNYYGYL